MICVGAEGFSFSLRLPFLLLHLLIFSLHLWQILSKYQQTSNYFWQPGPLFPSKRRGAEGEGVDEITQTDVI